MARIVEGVKVLISIIIAVVIPEAQKPTKDFFLKEIKNSLSRAFMSRKAGDLSAREISGYILVGCRVKP